MEPVALGIRTPDVLERLSTVLQIRGQQQGLEGQAAEVAGAKQTQAQRQGIADYFKANPLKHVGPDGLLDVNGMLTDPDLRNAAGDQLLPVLQSAAANRQQGIQNMQALTNLRGDQREAFAGLMNSLRGDKDVAADNEAGRQKVNRELLKYGELHGPDAYPVLKVYSEQLREAPRGHLADELQIIGMQGLAAGQQMSAQQPQYQDTGAQLRQISPNALPGAPASIDKTLPPGVSILTDQAGAQFAYNPQRNTVTPVGAGRGGGGSAPAPNAPPGASPSAPAPGFQQPTYPGQAEDIRQQQHDVATIRSTADQAPLQRSIYQKILQLSDDTNTGKFTAWLQSNPAISQLSGDSYQELSKYLEKNAIANMQAMGGGASDARLEAATQASGSAKFNPTALKEVTRFNYATNTALEAFRQGIDEAVGTSNPKYNELPRFKKDWSKNFDIDVFRLENAINDGDKDAQAKILEGLTPAQAKTLMEKRKNLTSLRSTGKLP